MSKQDNYEAAVWKGITQNLVTFTVTWSDRTEDGAGTFRKTNVRMPHVDRRFAACNIARSVFNDAEQYDRVHIVSIQEAW